MSASTPRYSVPFILSHWVSALLILVLLGLGWYVQQMPPTAPARSFLLDLHISLGLTAAILVLIQILLRILFKPPPFPDSFPLWQQKLAYTLYLLIYVSMILMPVSGYLRAVFSATPIRFWGYPAPVWGVADAGLADFFWTIHGIVAFVLTGLIVVHVGILVLYIVRRTGIAGRMLPSMGEEPPQPIQVGTTSADAYQIPKRLARNLRLFGWIEFWLQFALAFISGLLLVFATSGRAFNPASTGVGDGMYWAVHGFFLLCLAILLAFYYTRAAGKVVSTPDSYFNPKRKVGFWFLGTGMFIGLLGIFISFSGVALSISLLIAKTVSQPPGIAITDPTRIIRALDVFILLVNFNLLMAHFIGTGISLWLSIRASKARLEYLAISSKPDRSAPAEHEGVFPAAR